MLSDSQQKVLLEQYGVQMHEIRLLSQMQRIVYHGKESAYHRVLKYEIYHAAKGLKYIPFFELPFNSKYQARAFIDVFLLPHGIIVEVEDCSIKSAINWAKEYYKEYYCKKRGTEVFVLNYKTYQKIDLELWKDQIIDDLGLYKFSMNKWIEKNRKKLR